MGRRPTGSTRGGLARGGQKGGFTTAFAAEAVAEIEALVGAGTVDDWDFEAIETATRRKALRVAARAVEQRLNADTSGPRGSDGVLRVRAAGAVRRAPLQDL